jgi:hypothetical protein
MSSLIKRREARQQSTDVSEEHATFSYKNVSWKGKAIPVTDRGGP